MNRGTYAVKRSDRIVSGAFGAMVTKGEQAAVNLISSGGKLVRFAMNVGKCASITCRYEKRIVMRDVSYRFVDPEKTERTTSTKSGTDQIDLTDALNLTEMRGRLWYLEPGNDRKGTHRHETQEELYVVVKGDGRMEIDGETLTIPQGAVVGVPPETPRRLFNDTDEEHVWLIVGAPPVEGDGHQLS